MIETAAVESVRKASQLSCSSGEEDIEEKFKKQFEEFLSSCQICGVETKSFDSYIDHINSQSHRENQDLLELPTV